MSESNGSKKHVTRDGTDRRREGLASTCEALMAQIDHEQTRNPEVVGPALVAARTTHDPRVRELALSVIPDAVAHLPEWVEFVRSCVVDSDALLRCAALETVGGKRLVTLSGHSRERLNDRNELVRIEAIEATCRLRDRNALRQIRTLAAEDPSYLVRGYAARAVADLDGFRARDWLESRLQVERSSWTLTQVLVALVALGVSKYLPRLLARLRSRNYRIRCVVANNVPVFVTRDNASAVRVAVLAALEKEDTMAAAEALKDALGLLSNLSQTQAADEE
jgi:hypothetical protein